MMSHLQETATILINGKRAISFDGKSLRLDTAEDAQPVCHELTCEDFEMLILQGNTIGIEAAERIRLELAHHPELKEAHFKDIFTSRGREEVPVAMDHLLKGISEGGAQLTLLDLSDNAIGPIGAPSVIEFLNSRSAETLEKLYLNNCGLGPEGSTSIAACIPRLRKLREFICGRNRLENKGATNMSRALSELNTLEVLKLPQNGINVKGIAKLCEVLESNIGTIREIDLSDNTIKPKGADALFDPISKAKNLKILKLDDALLENEGFSTICDALSKSQALPQMKEASFEGNEIHGQNIIDLIHLTFKVCAEDFDLNLLANDFSPTAVAQLQALGTSININVTIEDPSDLDSYSDEDDDQDEDEEEREEGEYNEVETESSSSGEYDSEDDSGSKNINNGSSSPFISSFDKFKI